MPAQPPLLDLAARSCFINTPPPHCPPAYSPPMSASSSASGGSLTSSASSASSQVIDMWTDLAIRLDRHSTSSASKNVDDSFLEDLRKMCLEESTRITTQQMGGYSGMGSTSSLVQGSGSSLKSLSFYDEFDCGSSSGLVHSPNGLGQGNPQSATNQGLLWQQLAGLSLEDILPLNRLHNYVNLKTR